MRAPEFGNPDPRIVAQADWRSFIPTPEFPAYPSGHSTFAAAGAETIALIYGRDDVSFSGRSPDLVLWPRLRGVTRSWSSLRQVAEENGMSRLYGGVHWRIDHTEAVKAGQGHRPAGLPFHLPAQGIAPCSRTEPAAFGRSRRRSF